MNAAASIRKLYRTINDRLMWRQGWVRSDEMHRQLLELNAARDRVDDRAEMLITLMSVPAVASKADKDILDSQGFRAYLEAAVHRTTGPSVEERLKEAKRRREEEAAVAPRGGNIGERR